MKLKSVILADDSGSCDIADLFVMLKNSTTRLLEEYAASHEDIEVEDEAYLSDTITKQGLSEKLALVNSDSFMCFWYGHGKTDSFKIGNEDIVTTTENYYLFSNALIYTFSCLNGNDLAETIVANKAKAFVGYIGNANCPYGIDDVTCGITMSFISSLLRGKSISDAVENLKASYEEAVFNTDLEPFQRSRFQENRDNITLKGDGALTIENLMVV